MTRLSSKAIYLTNLLVFREALNESDIVHRLTPNTRNTVLPDTEYFENCVPKLPSGCNSLVI